MTAVVHGGSALRGEVSARGGGGAGAGGVGACRKGGPMAGDGLDSAATPLRVFGAMLRYYRTKAGLAQADLGERVHFSDDLISKIEMGQSTPSQEFAPSWDAVP